MPMPDASGAPGKVLSMDANNGATTLAKNRFTRKIKMVYRIDLFKHNAYAQSLANVMKPHEDRIRACYTDRLEKIPGLSGGLGFNIWLKKEVSAIHQIKRTSGSIKDKPLIDCLVGALRRMPLHSPANMRGRLDYVFNVVEQQIAAH
jgi:hypothetical protein